MSAATTAGRFRLAELMAALSLATDLGTGQPLEHALRTCVVTLRIGELAGLCDRELSDVYYVALLRFLGCSANARDMADLAGGDEIALSVAMAGVLGEAPPEFMRAVLPSLAVGQPAVRRARVVAGFLGTGPDRMRRGVAAHCELAENLASRIGLADGVRFALGQAFERWDGSGFPNGVEGEAIRLPARIIFLARNAEVLRSLMGTGGIVSSCAVQFSRPERPRAHVLASCSGENREDAIASIPWWPPIHGELQLVGIRFVCPFTGPVDQQVCGGSDVSSLALL